MLDTLLRRAHLKERIDELEEALGACQDELDELEGRFASTDERRKEAIRDHQTAREEVHRLEDRVETLEDRLERATEETNVAERGIHTLSYRRITRILDRLASVDATGEGAYTAMLEDEVPQAVSEQLGARVDLVRRAMPCLCLFDDEGLVELALEAPRPPPPFETWDDTFEFERGWFVPTGSFTFALIRSDLFTVGRYHGEGLTDIEGFESDVMGRHSKGGYSQARFERRRNEQIDRHIEQSTTRLASYSGDEPLILTGSKSVLDELAVEADATATVDASGKPTVALENAFDEFWTTTVHRL